MKLSNRAASARLDLHDAGHAVMRRELSDTFCEPPVEI